MPTSPSPRPEAAVLSSLPPSPSLLDQVFAHPRPWSEEFVDLQGSRTCSPGSFDSHAKGKGKQTLEDEDDEDSEDAPHHPGTHDAYPPTSDDAAETRRVEETLKRWELAERQRRKSARESIQHSPTPSLLSSVTRTATRVLSHRTSAGAAIGPGSARAFKSVDVTREGYVVQLDNFDHAHTSSDVVVHSPSSTLFSRNTSLDAETGAAASTSENPFVHPSERAHTHTALHMPATPASVPPPSRTPSPSPFGDAHAQQAVQGDPARHVSAEARKLLGRKSPPHPLVLSPPPEGVRHATQLQPTSQPVLRPRPPDVRHEVRWWHEWLCGCGEGPDRGGDNQAGRTNPFE